MSENLINQVNTGRLIKNIIGWADFNDLTTASAPIELTVADDWYQLTNDGAGDFTNTAYKVDGHKDIWDVDNQQFDFSDLRLGDTVDIRLDVEFDLNASNTDIGLRLSMVLSESTTGILIYSVLLSFLTCDLFSKKLKLDQCLFSHQVSAPIDESGV